MPEKLSVIVLGHWPSIDCPKKDNWLFFNASISETKIFKWVAEVL